MQCTVYRVQCFSVQCSVFSVQCLFFLVLLFFFALHLFFYVLAGKNESFIAVTVLLDTAQVNAKACGVNCKI